MGVTAQNLWWCDNCGIKVVMLEREVPAGWSYVSIASITEHPKYDPEAKTYFFCADCIALVPKGIPDV